MQLLQGGAEYTIWGHVVASPESGPRAVVSLVSPKSFVARPNTKGAPNMH
jgi:hypothetical protein